MPQRLPSYESCSPEVAVHNQEESTSPRNDNQKQEGKNKWRLRGLLWRMQLGVLPSRFDSVDALRRAAADGRRRYADLRRRLLVDPHLMEEGQKPPDVSMDNPLSLDPDSVWGKYFRNVEIERVIDKDLTRLYPEHGNFFHGSGCQAMCRRILLVWALIHPQLSYRQGMHELLAPLLYVLHVDLLQLAQIKKRYEDMFDDRFDEDGGDSGDFRRMKLPFNLSEAFGEHRENGHQASRGMFEHDELNVDLKVIVMGSDTYGAEGELGALFSARFMEHDAYCMFDALLGGQGGAVRMIDYFATSGVPDASAALYRTLAAADISLYKHLVELGVQPQYFALRWLRLLFGREFGLEDLLLVWDAIFSASNEEIQQVSDGIPECQISPRSATISAIAVSLLLHSRAALLAAPDATGCLQRLLNPSHIQDVRTFLENARLLQPLAQAAAGTPPPPVAKSVQHVRSGKSPQKGSGILRQGTAPCSPELLKMFLAEGYWEEKWKSSVLHKSNSEGAAKISRIDTKGKSTKSGKTSEVPKESTEDNSKVAPSRSISNGSSVLSSRSVEDKLAVKGSDASKASEEVQQVQEEASDEAREEITTESDSSDVDQKQELANGETSELPVSNEAKVIPDTETVQGISEEAQHKPDSNGSFMKHGKKHSDKYVGNGSASTHDEVVTINDPLGVSSSKPERVPNSLKSKPTDVDATNKSPENFVPTSPFNSLKKISTKREEASESQKKPKGPVALQSLGQSMVEQIQVLEGVLSQKVREGEQISKAFIGGKGHVSAIVALAELRKISNALLQM